MGIRFVLLVAGAICLIPAVASAQAVPPRDFVGPPVELAGSDPAVPAPPLIPGGMVPLPKSRFVGPPAPEPAVFGDQARAAIETAKTVNKVVGKSAGYVQQGAEFYQQAASAADALDPSKHPLVGEVAADAVKAGKVAETAKAVGTGTKVLSVATSSLDAAAKCSDPKLNTADCVQAGVNATASYVGALDAINGSPVAGRAAGALNVVSSAMTLDKACRGKEADAAKCAVASIDGAMAAASLVPVLKPMTTTYAVGMAIGTTATAGAEKLLGQSIGGYVYDKINADETSKMMEQAGSAQALEAARQKRHANYNRAAGDLASKQNTYEAEQARVQAAREASERAQARASSEAAANQAFYSNLMGALQVQRASTSSPSQGSPNSPTASPPPDSEGDYCSSVGRNC